MNPRVAILIAGFLVGFSVAQNVTTTACSTSATTDLLNHVLDGVEQISDADKKFDQKLLAGGPKEDLLKRYLVSLSTVVKGILDAVTATIQDLLNNVKASHICVIQPLIAQISGLIVAMQPNLNSVITIGQCDLKPTGSLVTEFLKTVSGLVNQIVGDLSQVLFCLIGTSCSNTRTLTPAAQLHHVTDKKFGHHNHH